MGESYPVFSTSSSNGSGLGFSFNYTGNNANGEVVSLDTVLGFGWSHSYNVSLFSQGRDLFKIDSAGKVTKFQRSGRSGALSPLPGTQQDIVEKPDGSIVISNRQGGTTFVFRKITGNPLRIAGAEPWMLNLTTDNNGNWVQLNYQNGLLAEAIDNYNRKIKFVEYDANHHLTRVQDPMGRETKLEYGGYNNLTKIIDPLNQSIKYDYDVRHQIVRKTDKNGNQWNYAYNSTGHVIGLTDGAGNPVLNLSNPIDWATSPTDLALLKLRTYIPSVTTRTDGLGKQWQYFYNTNGQITDSVAPDNATKTYTYDPVTLNMASMTENKTSLADINGHRTENTYDAYGNLTRERRFLKYPALSPSDYFDTVYTYVAPTTFLPVPIFDRVKTVTYPSGSLTQYEYDAHGNRIRESRDVGGLNLVTEWAYYTAGVSVPENPSGAGGLVKNETLHNGATLQTTGYKYDVYGNRNNVIDPENNSTSYEYDIVGNKTKMIDANGHVWFYAPYDGLDRLLAETDPSGFVTRYTYDGNGNRTQVQKQVTKAPDTFETTQYQYDLRDRLINEIRDPGGLNLVTSYVYDNNDNRIQLTDPRGKATNYTYDVQNRLAKVQDALNNAAETRYDPVGNRTCVIDANLHYTFFNYDALNRQTKESKKIGIQECKTGDADDIITESFYDSGATMACDPDPGSPTCNGPTPGSGNIAHSIDPEGNFTYFKYDKVDRRWITIRKVTDIADSCDGDDWCQYTKYDPASNVTARIDANGNRSNSTYYANNWLLTEANALNETTTFTYDGVGNVKTVQSPGDNLTTNTYSDRNELIQVDDKIGRVASHVYDGIGNRTQDCDGNNHCSAYAYDAVNRLIAVTDPMSNTTHYAYDADGNQVKTTDREHHATCYQYDDINRRILQVQKVGDSDCAVVDADDVWTKTHYDPVGNVSSLTSAKHGSTPAQCNSVIPPNPPSDCETTTYAYDEVNRLRQETYPDAGVRHFAYDRAGNLIQRIDQQGRTTDYVYNDLYYLTKRDYQVDVDDSFTYDVGGRMLQASRAGWLDMFSYDPANRVLQSTQDGKLVNYVYDTANRCRTLTYPSGKVVKECRDFRERLEDIDGGSLATYAYDLGNRVLTRAYGNGTTASYTYNDNNWITKLEHNKAGPTLIAGFGYTYDKEGNKRYEEKQHELNHSEAYHYDDLYRLIDFKVGDLDFVTATVPVPLTQTQYDLDKLGNWDQKIKDGVTQTRQHNAVNEITQINDVLLSYDDNGNLTEDKRYDYTYDQENRLLMVSYVDAGGAQVAGEYRYDALSRRIVKITGPTRGNKETHYFYDDARIIEEHDPLSNPEASYVYGNYIDEVLTMDRNLHTYYYHQNALWSVEAITDGAANVVETYAYDAYGHPAIKDTLGNGLTNAWGTAHSAIGNPWMFTGRQYDEESGLYYYRARVYDSDKGRFLQRDALEYHDGVNLYEYVRSKPILWVDPTGQEQSLSYDKAIEKKAGYCAQFTWKTRWKLSEKSIKGGFIIQEITFDSNVMDCNNQNINMKLTYWEAWEVKANSREIIVEDGHGTDFWKTKEEGCCTQGTVKISGNASFFEGLALPGDFIRNNRDTFADDGRSTRTYHNFGAGIGPVSRSVTGKWNCCKDGGLHCPQRAKGKEKNWRNWRNKTIILEEDNNPGRRQ
jgi:RHS repeat-associated protein